MPKAKVTPPKNRANSPSRPEARRWFEITNLAEEGYAEIKLRGIIGLQTKAVDYWTGEEYETGGAGTLQEFERELEALGDVRKLQLSIFSEGGDVFTGMAIHNLIARHPAKNKIAIIDGICASAATYPAMACGEIRIPANAWLMIHGTVGGVYGGPEEMRRYADMLDQMNTTLVNLYAARTGMSDDEVRAMLNAETWMDGKTAVENGFADTVLEPLANLAQRAGTLQPTNIAMLQNAPAEVLALFDMTRVANARTAAPSPMKRHPGPLMNAATETSANGGGGAPAPTPTPAPTAPVTPPIEPPTNQVTPPAPPAAAPVVDLAGIITAAVTNAVKPLQERLDSLEGLNRAGVTPQNLGGSAPVAGVVPDAGNPTPVKTPIDMKNMSAAQLINLGRKQLAAANKTQPLEQVPTP
jgi:ATP-dependent protease ClpP protease subunit